MIIEIVTEDNIMLTGSFLPSFSVNTSLIQNDAYIYKLRYDDKRRDAPKFIEMCLDTNNTFGYVVTTKKLELGEDNVLTIKKYTITAENPEIYLVKMYSDKYDIENLHCRCFSSRVNAVSWILEMMDEIKEDAKKINSLYRHSHPTKDIYIAEQTSIYYKCTFEIEKVSFD